MAAYYPRATRIAGIFTGIAIGAHLFPSTEANVTGYVVDSLTTLSSIGAPPEPYVWTNPSPPLPVAPTQMELTTKLVRHSMPPNTAPAVLSLAKEMAQSYFRATDAIVCDQNGINGCTVPANKQYDVEAYLDIVKSVLTNENRPVGPQEADMLKHALRLP